MLKSVNATAETTVSVLGQNDKVVEYRPEVIPATKWEQTPSGLRITATRAQRLYNDRRWPNAVVLKITHAEPGLDAPAVLTTDGERRGSKSVFRGRIESLGDASRLEVGFEWRLQKDMADLYEPDDPWKFVAAGSVGAAGAFEAESGKPPAGRAVEYRAVAKHPIIDIYGAVKPIE